MPKSFRFTSDTRSSISAFAITPNDGVDLATNTRGIYIGGAGNVTVVLEDDISAVTFVAPPVGSVLPIRAKRVMSTGTTATNMLGLI